MKVGDLVMHADAPPARLARSPVGILMGWYDSSHGYVMVKWHSQDRTEPMHISKLEVISESR